MNNPLVETYLSKIKNELDNSTKADEFIKGIENEIYEYFDSVSDCTEEDLVSHFGKPEDIANEFTESSETVTPREVKKSKWKRNLIIAILIALIAYAGYYAYDLYVHTHGYLVETVIIYD